MKYKFNKTAPPPPPPATLRYIPASATGYCNINTSMLRGICVIPLDSV